MKKSTFLVFALFAGAMLIAKEIAFENGGFENKNSSWSIDKYDWKMSEITHKAAYQGKLGLRVVDNNNKRGSSVTSAKIPLNSSKFIEFSFFARTIKNNNIAIHIRYFDKNKKIIKNANNIVKIPLSKDWEKVILATTTPENAEFLSIWIHSFNSSKVTVDFDNFDIKSISKQELYKNMLDGGFENKNSSWNINKYDWGMSKIIPEAAYQGKLGVRVIDDNDKKGSSMTSPMLPLIPCELLQLLFYAKSNSDTGIAVYIQYYNAKKQLLEVPASLLKIPESQDWEEYELVSEVPEDAKFFTIWIHSIFKAKVTAFFDDFRVNTFTKKEFDELD